MRSFLWVAAMSVVLGGMSVALAAPAAQRTNSTSLSNFDPFNPNANPNSAANTTGATGGAVLPSRASRPITLPRPPIVPRRPGKPNASPIR